MVDSVITPDTRTQCRLCGRAGAELSATIRRRPACESDYGIEPDRYLRHVLQCSHCGVYYQAHGGLPDDLYEEIYNEAAHENGLEAKFEVITRLPFERSDNKQRVRRVHEFLIARGVEPSDARVLDIGTGLCVFLAEMRKYGYRTYGVDPDHRAVEHAREVVGVDAAWTGRLEDLRTSKSYDLVTLNKVLEHVSDPLGCLRNAVARIADGRFLYLELPDGELAAAAEGIPTRQEFVIEHLTVFTARSILWLLESAGLTVIRLERCHDPSGKYTLFAFATPNRATDLSPTTEPPFA